MGFLRLFHSFLFFSVVFKIKSVYERIYVTVKIVSPVSLSSLFFNFDYKSKKENINHFWMQLCQKKEHTCPC